MINKLATIHDYAIYLICIAKQDLQHLQNQKDGPSWKKKKARLILLWKLPHQQLTYHWASTSRNTSKCAYFITHFPTVLIEGKARHFNRVKGQVYSLLGSLSTQYSIPQIMGAYQVFGGFVIWTCSSYLTFIYQHNISQLFSQSTSHQKKIKC